jgi:hypothetical protein
MVFTTRHLGPKPLFSLCCLLGGAAAVLAACAGGETTSEPPSSRGGAGHSGTGGSAASGGGTGTGGSGTSGGSTGDGGATTGTGGSTGSGGSGDTGGGPATGGSPGTGGATGSGGDQGTGGAAATGGSTGTGGAPADNAIFAIIGDFGSDNEDEQAVADLVKGWNPDFIATVGDNDYDGPGTIDTDIGKYYASYIGSYKGSHGSGSPTNRFWPAAGNHDWDLNDLEEYTDYFTLPGNERYYEKQLGLVHLFMVDSDEREPDGITADSKQAMWLKNALAASKACYKLVLFHHAPYTSGNGNGPTPELGWPYKEWGATIVITGHEHVYERLEVNGLPYLINGLGGDSSYSFGKTVAESKFRYNAEHGAMKVLVTKTGITYEFYAASNKKIESFSQAASCQ